MPPPPVAAAAPHSRQNSGTAANYPVVTMPGVHETNCDFKLIVDDIKTSDQVSGTTEIGQSLGTWFCEICSCHCLASRNQFHQTITKMISV